MSRSFGTTLRPDPSDSPGALAPLPAVALVLAGGESRRMGSPKAFLPLAGKPLLQHVVERLAPLFQGIAIVAKDPQPYATFGLPVIADVEPLQGPLAGLYSGLLKTQAPWCFLVGCDMPLLSHPLAQRMAHSLSVGDVVACRVQGRDQPLPAFYSQRCLPHARELLSRGNTSLRALIAACQTVILLQEEVEALDPGLRSFLDVDTPEQLASLATDLLEDEQ